MGYGANQKTCYKKALRLGADIIVMLHPDYQYTPKLIHSMCYLIANGLYHIVLGSRILGKDAIKGKIETEQKQKAHDFILQKQKEGMVLSQELISKVY